VATDLRLSRRSSVRGLAERSGYSDADRVTKALVQIRAGGTTPPLYCVHAQAGHLRLFANLAPHLDPDRPVYGLRAVARDDAALSPYRRFEDMAERYASEIRAHQPSGAYYILAECNGGMLALELAQQLCATGAQVPLLALVDSFGPGEPRLRRLVPRRAYRYLHAVRMLEFHLLTVWRLDVSAKKAYVCERLARLLLRQRNRAAARRGATSPELIRQRGFGEALAVYQPERYPGRVVLFRGARLHWGLVRTNDLGWAAVAPDLEVVELPAYFGTTMLEPAVRLLAERMVDALDASTSMTDVG
jgi:thioesterase domain-containing protein